MLTGHLAHDLLHTLADLDKGYKLLAISSLLRSTDSTTEHPVKHPIGLAAVIVLQWSLVYLVSDNHSFSSRGTEQLTQLRSATSYYEQQEF